MPKSLTSGLSRSAPTARWSRDFSADETRQAENAFPNIADWLSEGLLVEDDQRLRFAPRGLLLANALFVRLV